MGNGTGRIGVYGVTRWLIGFGLCLLLAGFVFGCAGPAREPWVGYDFWRSTNEAAVGRELSVVLSYVDDIADIWVVNDLTFETDYLSPVLRAEWQNVDGFAKGNLTRHLDTGINYLILTLFNRKYTGPSIYGPAGKYSVDFTLLLDSRVLYEKRLYENFNYEKLIFAAIFKIDLAQDGLLAFKPMSQEEKSRLMKLIQTGIAGMLHDTAGKATLNVNAGVYRIILDDPELRPILEDLRKFQRGAQP